MPPLSRDSAPDSTPETLPEAAAETQLGHARPSDGELSTESVEARSTLPDAAPGALSGEVSIDGVPMDAAAAGLVPPFEGVSSGVEIIEPVPHTTQGGTQISSFGPTERRALLDSIPSQRPASSDKGRGFLDSGALDERFRRIEHRLDQLDARMRLLEKGAERSAAGGRAGLLWWGVVLLLAVLWGVLRRG